MLLVLNKIFKITITPIDSHTRRQWSAASPITYGYILSSTSIHNHTLYLLPYILNIYIYIYIYIYMYIKYSEHENLV